MPGYLAPGGTSGYLASPGGATRPASTTDNALVRWDGTTGSAIQGSGWVLSDGDDLAVGALGDKLIMDADQDTYLYCPSDDQLDIYVAGGFCVRCTNGKLRFGTGSAADMQLVATADTNTGFYWGGSDVCGVGCGGADAVKFDATAVAGNTRLFVYDVDNAQLERVTIGAADSGGAGYKVLRIPN